MLLTLGYARSVREGAAVLYFNGPYEGCANAKVASYVRTRFFLTRVALQLHPRPVFSGT